MRRFPTRQTADRSNTFLICAAATTLVLLIGWITYSVTRPPPVAQYTPKSMFDSPEGLNVFQFVLIPPANPRSQRLALHAMWTGIVLTALMMGWRAAKKGVWPISLVSASYLVLSASALCLLIKLGPGWETASTGGAIAAVAMILLLVYFPARIGKRWLTVIAVLFAIILQLPGIWRPFDLSTVSWTDIAIIQNHFAVVLSLGRRFAEGFALFKGGTPHYGVLLPLILSVVERIAGPLSWGDYSYVLKILQAIYLAVFLWCCYRVSGRAKLAFVLLSVFIVYRYHYKCWSFSSRTIQPIVILPPHWRFC